VFHRGDAQWKNSFLVGGDLVRIFPTIQLAKGKLTYYQGIISLR